MRYGDLITYHKAILVSDFRISTRQWWGAGIELWDFRVLIRDIAEACKEPTYFLDDTLRTAQLFQRARGEG